MIMCRKQNIFCVILLKANLMLCRSRNEDEALFPKNFEELMNAQAQKYFELKSDDTARIKKCFDSIKEIVDTPFRQLVIIHFYE